MKALFLILFFSLPAHALDVPLPSVRVGLEPASKIPRWLIELKAPPGHHFNLSAPMRVRAGAVLFGTVLKEERVLGFAASSEVLSERDTVSTSVYLCDDAKTYCVKKSRDSVLKVDPGLQTFEKIKVPHAPEKKQKRDRFGFRVQDPDAALAEALKTGKPLLIDFYGVWCPPCNLYEEFVFPGAGFRKMSRGFVLLRMDADQESSFELKSKLRVGSYPTLIVAKVRSHETSGHEVIELGRVVGYLPERELIARLSGLASARVETVEERIVRQKSDLLESVQLAIEQELESRNPVAASSLIEDGLRLFPRNLELRALGVRARVLHPEPFEWRQEDSALVREMLADPKKKQSRILLLALDLIQGAGGSVPGSLRDPAFEGLSELRDRLDSSQLFLSGTETSSAELDVLEMDLARVFSDPSRVKEARTRAIASYERIMKALKKPDSRGYNLELSSLLTEDGQFERALRIYERFLSKFPKEFTFHFGAAKAHLERNDLKSAREEAEQAVRYAYGDNLIRSMDRLLKVMHKQGETGFAIRRGEDFLKSIHVYPELRVRTGRYVSALTKTLEDLKKETTKP